MLWQIAPTVTLTLVSRLTGVAVLHFTGHHFADVQHRCSNVSMFLRISTKCFLFPGIVPLLYFVGNKTYYYYYIALATCSQNQPLLNTNIEENCEATLWRHRWRHHLDKNFFWHNLGRSFISEVKLKLCFIFQNFQNGSHFELAKNFFTGNYTGSWIYQKDSH